MRRKILATALFIAASLIAAPSEACRVAVDAREHHNSIAQGLMATIHEQLSASSRLDLVERSEPHAILFELIGAPANDVSNYPEFPHRAAQKPTDDPRFRAFYVITDADARLLGASYKSCNEYGQECTIWIVRELEEACRRMPNSSFKPTPLRGAA